MARGLYEQAGDGGCFFSLGLTMWVISFPGYFGCLGEGKSQMHIEVCLKVMS